jgi:hypothetical protein
LAVVLLLGGGFAGGVVVVVGDGVASGFRSSGAGISLPASSMLSFSEDCCSSSLLRGVVAAEEGLGAAEGATALEELASSDPRVESCWAAAALRFWAMRRNVPTHSSCTSAHRSKTSASLEGSMTCKGGSKSSGLSRLPFSLELFYTSHRSTQSNLHCRHSRQ